MFQVKQQIGRMDKRITIQRMVVGSNVSNEDEELGWETVSLPWAEVDEKSGAEGYEADQKVARTTAIFIIRYMPGMSEKWRIVYNSRIYDIKAIIYAERKRFIHITGVSGGQYVNNGEGFNNGYNDQAFG